MAKTKSQEGSKEVMVEEKEETEEEAVEGWWR